MVFSSKYTYFGHDCRSNWSKGLKKSVKSINKFKKSLDKVNLDDIIKIRCKKYYIIGMETHDTF